MHLHNKYIVNIKSFIASGIVLKESFLRFYSNIAEQTHHIEFVPQISNIDCFSRNSLIDASQRQSLYYAEDL